MTCHKRLIATSALMFLASAASAAPEQVTIERDMAAIVYAGGHGFNDLSGVGAFVASERFVTAVNFAICASASWGSAASAVAKWELMPISRTVAECSTYCARP